MKTPRFVLPAALLALAGCMSVQSLDRVLAEAAREPLTSKILAADGAVLASLHAEVDREEIPLNAIPSVVRNAVIAIEDARFYSHGGVDIRGVLRAFARDAAEGKIVEGGSTITEQLVKNLLTDREKTLRRKLHEALLAHQLEERFTKDEILARYLNTVYFGRGAYGIETAARTFFGVHAAQLTLPQGALLAGSIAAPSRYDPMIDPDAALARRTLVLGRMRSLGSIDATTQRAALATPLGVHRAPREVHASAPYFVDYVKSLIAADDTFKTLGATPQERDNALFKGGLRIYTTLDPAAQAAAETSLASVLTKPGDPSGALVAVRPSDGAIVAMVGGRNYWDTRDASARFNIATQGRRQPGSAFKPFTLVAALEDGIPLDRSYTAGARITLRMPDGTLWSVHNNEGTSFGGRLTLQRATAYSVNVVYAQVLREVGAGAVVDVAHRMGIASALRAYPGIALGAQEVSPLEMAGAYATLAAGGVRTTPRAITKITDASGKLLWANEEKPLRVLTQQVSAEATQALRDVMAYGTGAHLQTGFPVAGKSGTTDGFGDAWFAGYSPRLATVTWVGFPRGRISMQPPRTRIRVYGASWPGQIWKTFMLATHQGFPALDFPEPSELVVKVRVDVLRGCLPNAYTPSFLIEEKTFPRGSEPTQECTEPSSGVIERTPAVLGMDPEPALRAMREAGLDASVERRYCASYPPGVVCAQAPEAGARSSVGAHATIWVSDDAAVAEVPMVLDLARARATSMLRNAGFNVKVMAEANHDGVQGCRTASESGGGVVWAQDPCAGETYGRDAVVTIYVNPS